MVAFTTNVRSALSLIRKNMLPERFTNKITVTEDGHWLWNAHTTKTGYGQFWDGNTQVYAHRFAWEQLKGPIPDETPCVLHKNSCHIRHCCNPWTCLYLGTQKQNIKDAIEIGTHYVLGSIFNLSKTNCPRGHEYTPENTRIRNGRRECRACDRERKRELCYKRKRKGA